MILSEYRRSEKRKASENEKETITDYERMALKRQQQ